MVDRGERRGDGAEVGQHPIGRPACQVVVGAAVIDQREVRPAHQDAQTGPDVDGIDGKGRRRPPEAPLVEDTARPRLRPRTYLGYKHHVDADIVPTLGAAPLRKLTPQHVRRLLNAKSEGELARRTVAGIRAVLRAALNDAVACFAEEKW
jgi:hypothetical protein